MASRAILSSGHSICLRCQLRSSGVLPYRRILSTHRIPLTGIASVTYRRWASTIEQNAPEPVPVETAPPDVTPRPLDVTPPPLDATPPPLEVTLPLAENITQKEGEAAPKYGDVAPKEGDAAPKEGDAVPKEGDAVVAELAPPTPERPKKRSGLPQLENRRLLILEMPTRKPRKAMLPQNIDVEEEKVDELSSYLLTFEEKADAYELAIDIMRPTPSDGPGGSKNAVSMKRFQQIDEQLGVQFVRTQLVGYVNAQHKAQELPPVSKGMTKMNAISHILKKVWKVEISEEIHEKMDLIVEKKLEMGKEDIYFLISQNGRNLRIWAQDHTARITVNLRDSSLSIEATMVNIEQLEQKIPELLAQKCYENVDLTALTRLSIFNKSYIPTISKLTGTYIQQVVHPENMYHVSALGPDRGPLEDARRLMFDSHELCFRTSSLLVDTSSSPGTETASNLRGALYRIAEDQALTWMMRGRDWSRWRSVKTKNPVTLEMSPSQHKIAALIKQWAPAPNRKKLSYVDPEERLKLGLGGIQPAEGMEKIKALLDLSAAAEEKQYSDLFPQPEYTATLGFVMLNSTMQPIKANTLDEVLNKEPERVFCENIPGLTYLVADHELVNAPEKPANANPYLKLNSASDLDLDPETGEHRIRDFEPPPVTLKAQEGDANKNTLLIRFSPSPWEHPEDFETYPPVEMEVEVDSMTGEVRNPKVVAVHSDSVADLMMPVKECDVRFRRRLLVPLHIDKSGKIVKTARATDGSEMVAKGEASTKESESTKEEAVISKVIEPKAAESEHIDAETRAEAISPETIESEAAESEAIESEDIDAETIEEALALEAIEPEAIESEDIDAETIEEALALEAIEPEAIESEDIDAETLEEALALEAIEPEAIESEDIDAEALEEALALEAIEPEATESEALESEAAELEPIKSSSFSSAPQNSETSSTPTNLIPPHLPDQASTILSYLSSSRLSPTANDRLQPSSELTLQIPAYLCTTLPQNTSNPTDTVPVKYIFTSISYATTTGLKRQGWYLNKKVVEGGLSGGKKAMVEMEFRKIPGREEEVGANWEKWSESVLGLVARLGQVLGQRRNIFVGRK